MLSSGNSGWDLRSIRYAFSILNIAKSSKGTIINCRHFPNFIPTIHPFCVIIYLASPETIWWCLINTSRHAIHINLLKGTSDHSNNYTAALKPCYCHSTRLFLCCCLLIGAWTICPWPAAHWQTQQNPFSFFLLVVVFAWLAGKDGLFIFWRMRNGRTVGIWAGERPS